MKAQVDKHRKDRQFTVGDDVFLKLQPYAKSSLVNRPCAKLSRKFYGPCKVSEHIDTSAYRLDLPPASSIHTVFHVSQLKPFTAHYSSVFTELSKVTGSICNFSVVGRHSRAPSRQERKCGTSTCKDQMARYRGRPC